MMQHIFVAALFLTPASPNSSFVTNNTEIFSMEKPQPFKKIAAGLACLALLLLVHPARAQLTVTGTDQLGAVPLTPAWTAASGSLIAGLTPTVANGNFGEYTGANANNLTKPGIPLTIYAYSSPRATNLEVCGNDGTAGTLLVYTLPASTYGYNITNITVYGGWQDGGRDAQDYTVYYSTTDNPGTFILLTSVNYLPSNPSSTGSANRVIINDLSGAAIAKNVAVLKFDFTSPSAENGAVGYTAITVRGVAATTSGFNITQMAFNSSQRTLSLAWDSQFGQSFQVSHSPTISGPWTPAGAMILADDIVAGTVVNTGNSNDFFRVEQLSVAESATGQPQVILNPTNQTVTMANGKGDLQIRLNYAGGCRLDHVRVDGNETVSAQTGVSTGIEVDGNWVTTRSLSVAPQVNVSGNTVTINNIQFATGGIAATETWQFQVRSNNIQWSISRNYLSGGTLNDSYFPGWDFLSTGTWTAGLLDTGGVAWMRLLASGSSYGAHAGAVTFWNDNTCLKITPQPVSGQFFASRFSQQPSGVLSFAQSVSSQSLATEYALHRSNGSLDIWAPYQVTPGTVQTTLTLETPDLATFRYRGSFNGIDGAAVGDVLDTIARYGVVDQQLVGGNGWLSGFVCLNEPFFAEMALAIGDTNYTANLATSLDAWRDDALQTNGRVYSRWHHDTSDNIVPGTYNPLTGYYECGWGYLLDSNPDYPAEVAEEFDLTGDLSWLQAHKEPCERALNWLLSRDTTGNGLVEMMTQSHTQGQSSDWIDIIWASWENAFVNAKLYNALTLWSERETILGDTTNAARFSTAAANLKQTFILPISQGGFWDPTNGWFAYWRDQDGTIHGDNLVTPVNFAAVAYGLCTSNQQQTILNVIQTNMLQENLFHWPICFTSFASDEGGGSNFPFPNYENGDIFLSWGELAIRAYSQYNPAIAVSYVNLLLNQYNKDGLSYQRYLRASQTGSGNDILAGNSTTIVGLYRDIYGIRPQWDRLLIDPHLTPALAGTQLSYPLRGQTYVVTLNTPTTTATVSNFTVTATTPFALTATAGQVSFWPGSTDGTSLQTGRQAGTAVQFQLLNWNGSPVTSCSWTESSATAQTLSHSLSGLSPGLSYSLSVNGSFVQTMAANLAGELTFQQAVAAGVSVTISVTLAP
jgi:hypothetical protein